MSKSDLLPLALLYVDGSESIDGITRFQKLVFLAQKETDIGIGFDFEADKYGPFSSDLYNAIDELENRGLIRQETEYTRGGNEKYVYSLTPQGQQAARKILNKDNTAIEQVFDAAEEIKSQHNDQTLERLLRYVYGNYEGYTENSELDI